jgi:hypothetical protein
LSCDNIRLLSDSTALCDWIYDRVLIDNVSIGNSP